MMLRLPLSNRKCSHCNGFILDQPDRLYCPQCSRSQWKGFDPVSAKNSLSQEKRIGRPPKSTDRKIRRVQA